MSKTAKKAKAMCDVCGFVYDKKVMRLNSYKMLVCPTDFEGNYDLKNHPQNKSADVRDDTIVPNARPDIFGRNIFQIIKYKMEKININQNTCAVQNSGSSCGMPESDP